MGEPVTDYLSYRDEVRWFPYPDLIILNRWVGHGWSFYPCRNIFFCNIPKCASTSVKKYILTNESLTFNEPFYFTVIRNPKERLKSALWMINAARLDRTAKIYDQPGVKHLSFNVCNFVDEMKRKKLEDYIFMHTAPQTEFINNSPLAGHFDLKIYRIDQVNEIFNVEMPRENSSIYDQHPAFLDSYKRFTDVFNEQYNMCAHFLQRFYLEDTILWNSLNK